MQESCTKFNNFTVQFFRFLGFGSRNLSISVATLVRANPNAFFYIFILNILVNGVIVFANEQARVTSRLSSSDLNQKTHWELFPETVGTPVEASYRRTMTERSAEHLDVRASTQPVAQLSLILLMGISRFTHLLRVAHSRSPAEAAWLRVLSLPENSVRK